MWAGPNGTRVGEFALLSVTWHQRWGRDTLHLLPLAPDPSPLAPHQLLQLRKADPGVTRVGELILPQLQHSEAQTLRPKAVEYGWSCLYGSRWAGPEGMKAGGLTPPNIPYNNQEREPCSLPGLKGRVGPGGVSVGESNQRPCEQSCPRSLMPAALGELAEAVWESSPR